MNPPRFPTIAANWAHFDKVDIAPNAPQIQRDEMKRAFYAGASSALLLSVVATSAKDPHAEIAALNAELATFLTIRKASVQR